MKDINFLIANDIDVNASLELLGDIEMYNETLNDFINEGETRKKQLQDFIAQNDMENYAILAHSIKSDSKYLGFKKLAEIAYNHELKGKENDLDYVTNHFNELNDELCRILNIVNDYLEG